MRNVGNAKKNKVIFFSVQVASNFLLAIANTNVPKASLWPKIMNLRCWCIIHTLNYHVEFVREVTVFGDVYFNFYLNEVGRKLISIHG